MIEGRLKLDTWENKEGQKRSKLHVVGERMQMLGGRGGGGGGGSRSGGSQGSRERYADAPAGDHSNAQPSGGGDDDIPF